MPNVSPSPKQSQSQRTPRNISSGLTPYQGPFDREAVIHLLKRTMFGASVSDVNYFAGLTLSQAVEELINPTAPLPSPPLNDYHNNTPDPNVAPWQTWVNSQTNDGTLNFLRISSFKKWWAGVLINQDRSIKEKLSLFWSNHWGTETNVINNAILCYKHHNVLRNDCLGNFKSMVKNITIDSGMLVYLNGYLNTKFAPDENYGREIQELFTVGKDPVSNLAPYTEEDVKAASKVLTGWRINGTTGISFFDPAVHDTSNKSFSSFYNGRVITGRSGAAGAQETDELIDMLFSKNETAKHIIRKLYRWFVYYEIDDQVEQLVIEPLALIFQQNNFEIKPVLRTLLLSEHFFDTLNRGCLIKSPCDLVVGNLREYQVSFPISSDAESNYGHWAFVAYYLILLTQNLGDPPGVSGWPAYYQQPLYHEIWINHDSLPKRNQFTDYLIYAGYSINNTTIKTDGVSFAKLLPNPSDPNALVKDAMKLLLGVPLTDASLGQLKSNFLLSGQATDDYWTSAWNTYIANPSPTNFNIVNTRLRDLFKYFMNLAEYQLC